MFMERNEYSGLPLCLDPCFFPFQAPQVIQSGTPHPSPGNHFDTIDYRGVKRKSALHTDAIGNLPDCKSGATAAASLPDDNAFKGLNSLFLTFDNPYIYLDAISGLKTGEIGPDLLSFNHFNEIHASHTSRVYYNFLYIFLSLILQIACPE
jgi:hypothetical protein